LWLDPKIATVKSPAINTLMARGENRVWMVLMNESDSSTNAPLTLDKAKLGLMGTAYTIYDSAGKTTTALLGANPTISVPAKGLVALSFPAAKQTVRQVPPLENGRTSQKLEGEWGTLEAFRIRSPFGKDSLYVVLTGRPTEGATATLQVEGQEPMERKTYPFEFSVYPVSMDKDLKFTVQTRTADGKNRFVDAAGTQGDSSLML
jgi:hypothetical protein